MLTFSDHGLPKKLAKMVLNQTQNCLAALGRLAGVVDFPVPPNSSIRKTGGKGIRSYYIRGLHTALPIATCAVREGVRLDLNIRVLDFGCGVAAQLLHFTRNYPAPSYYACDVDDTAVAFVRTHYPRVAATVNRFSPPLPYEPAFFDMVYSVSIFTHLSLADQALWLKELARVTKPGGWCFLSTEGLASLPIRSRNMGEDETMVRSRLETDGVFFKEYPDWRKNVQHQATLRVTSLMVGVERSYGTTLVSPDYIRRHWPAAGFEVRAVVPGVVNGQDLVVLRRD